MGQIIEFSKEPEDIGEWMREQLNSDQGQIKDRLFGSDATNAANCEGFKPLPSYTCSSGWSPFGDYFSKLGNMETAFLGMLATCMWINTQEKRDCETCECKGLCGLFKNIFEKEYEKMKDGE